MQLFHGLSAFPITPSDAHGRVDTDALAGLLQRLDAARVDSIGLLGSTGGYAYLTREERKRAIIAAQAVVGGRTPLIVGVGALRTDEAMALARDAAEAGADGLLLAPMSYTPLTDEEVYQHFAAVAAASTLPLCIYNNPSTTRFVFSEALIARIAGLDRIAAVKMPLAKDNDFAGEIARLRAATPQGFAVGYSADWGVADALLAGADGWYSVIGGILPEPTLKLARAAQSGDAMAVQRITTAFEPLWDLFKEVSSFRVVHAIAELLQLADGKPQRPVLPLPREIFPRIEQALASLATLD